MWSFTLPQLFNWIIAFCIMEIPMSIFYKSISDKNSDVAYWYSGKDINLRNSQPFVVILLIALLFGLISHNPAEVIFIIAFGYSLSGYFSLIRTKFKTSKNLLDVDIFDEK